MNNEFYISHYSKDELKRLILEAQSKLQEIENEEKFQYKPLAKVNTTYISKTNIGYALHRTCCIKLDRLGVSVYDSLYVTCNRITFEEEETIMNKDLDELIQNGVWKEVDNSMYDMAWDEWEHMNDDICSVEAMYGSNLLTKLNNIQ